MKLNIWSVFPVILIAVGITIIALIYFPVARQEVVYRINQSKNKAIKVIDNPREATAAAQTAGPAYTMQPAIIIPKSFDFSVVIPAIGVNSLVFPNIDSGNEAEYKEYLKKGVAHAKGSALPSEPGPVFIFGHSTDSFYNITHYNAAFFLLPKLLVGDEALVFYKEQKYAYRVTETKIVNPEEITGIVQNIKSNTLILQTCWPPGTTLKRLLVIARQ